MVRHHLVKLILCRQLPDSIGQAGLRNIELLHCMADGAGNSRDIAKLLKGHGSFLSACFLSYRRAAKNATYFLL